MKTTNSYTIFFSIALLLIDIPILYTQSCITFRQRDSLALLNIYSKLSAKGLIRDWDFTKPLNEIDPLRIGLDITGCRISSLEISCFNEILNPDTIRFIYNEMPIEVFQLSGLRRLIISGTKIKGPIPNQLYDLEYLTELNLNGNEFNGSLSSEIAKLQNLKSLSLAENRLEGQIIPQFFSLTNLEELTFRQNKLTGEIPKDFEKLKNLKKLYLGQNEFTGTIPIELTYCSKLERLSIIQNKLEGTIPIELENLTSLKDLNVEQNNLDSIAKFQKLKCEVIGIFSNKMTFDDILPFKEDQDQNNPGVILRYQPQQEIIRLEKVVMLDPGESYSMEIPFDRNVITNRYDWKKNDKTVEYNRICKIDKFKKTDEGNYVCTITNIRIPVMKLIVLHHTLKCKPQTGNIHLTFCDNENRIVQNIRFDKHHRADTILLPGQSFTGCDSVLYVSTTIKATSGKDIYAKFCEGDYYELHNQQYFFPGVYKQTLLNTAGCDSMLFLFLDYKDRIIDNAIITNDDGTGNGTIELFPTIGTPPFLYKWNTGSDQSRIFQLKAGNTYLVTITDSEGCFANYSYTIKWVSSTNGGTETIYPFNMFPIPAHGGSYLHIQFPDNFCLDGSESVWLYNSQQAVLRNINVSNLDHQLLTVFIDRDLIEGHYILEIKRHNSIVGRKKFLILDD
jgi:hypothetical protein